MPEPPRYEQVPVYAEDRGRLTLADFAAMPFTPTRCYVLSSIPPGGRRGGHGYRTQSRYLIVIAGRMQLTVGEQRRPLQAPESVFIPPGNWHELQADGAGLTVLVFADGIHDPADQFDR